MGHRKQILRRLRLKTTIMPPLRYTFKGILESVGGFPESQNSPIMFHVIPANGTSPIRFSTFKRKQVSALKLDQKVNVTFELNGAFRNENCSNFLNATKIEAVEWEANEQNPPYDLSGTVHRIEQNSGYDKIIIQHGETVNHFRMPNSGCFPKLKEKDPVSLQFEIDSVTRDDMDSLPQNILRITKIDTDFPV